MTVCVGIVRELLFHGSRYYDSKGSAGAFYLHFSPNLSTAIWDVYSHI